MSALPALRLLFAALALTGCGMGVISDGTGGGFYPDAGSSSWPDDVPGDGDGDNGGDGDGDNGGDGDGDSGGDGDGDGDGPLPPRPLPSLGALTVDCGARTLSSLVLAKDIYDDYLGNSLPNSDADFSWHTDTSLVTPTIVDTVTTHALTGSHTQQEYYDFFDFNPQRFERTTSRANIDIFAEFNPESDRYAPYRRFNPYDYIPITATHYARSSTSDVIATQFAYRIACFRAQIEQSFAECPDCDDFLVALSGNDMYGIFEVRFVRDHGGQLQVSRTFKMISIDASGHSSHFWDDTNHYHRFARDGLWAYRRIEISGRMAQNLGTYGSPTAVLIRAL